MHLVIICFILEKHVHPRSIEFVFNLKQICAEVYHLDKYTESEGINWGDDRNIKKKTIFFFGFG